MRIDERKPPPERIMPDLEQIEEYRPEIEENHREIEEYIYRERLLM